MIIMTTIATMNFMIATPSCTDYSSKAWLSVCCACCVQALSTVRAMLGKLAKETGDSRFKEALKYAPQPPLATLVTTAMTRTPGSNFAPALAHLCACSLVDDKLRCRSTTDGFCVLCVQVCPWRRRWGLREPEPAFIRGAQQRE